MNKYAVVASLCLVAFAAIAQPVDPAELRGDDVVYGFVSWGFLGAVVLGLPLLFLALAMCGWIATQCLMVLAVIGHSIYIAPRAAIVTTLLVLLFLTFAPRPSTVWLMLVGP
jgi:hypothetical protein